MHKQSLFHISKRDALPWYQRVLIRGGAILLALIVCALVTMLLTGENPISIYGTIFYGAFGTARKSWVTFQNLAVLLGISLAVTPAFKMRFWNIGAEGQVLIGCLATAACMICLGDKLPSGLLILVMLAAALAAGALWGFLPSFFKAKWNTNETLFTLMMNYIATQLAAFFIIIWEVPKGAGKIGIINQNSEAGWLPVIGGKQYLLTILVVAVMTILMYIYLTYSKHGYEIAVVGESQRTASYAGIKVERTRIISIIMSTVFAGFGMILYLQNMGNLSTYSSHSQIGMFCIAALLVGGASVDRASIGNVFVGVTLFHLMFIVAPAAGAKITGDSMIGEYFRVFISYGVITVALIMYETKKRRNKSMAGQELAAAQKEEAQ